MNKPARLVFRMFFFDHVPVSITVGIPPELVKMLDGRKIKTIQVALESQSSLGNIPLLDFKNLPHGG